MKSKQARKIAQERERLVFHTIMEGPKSADTIAYQLGLSKACVQDYINILRTTGEIEIAEVQATAHGGKGRYIYGSTSDQAVKLVPKWTIPETWPVLAAFYGMGK